MTPTTSISGISTLAYMNAAITSLAHHPGIHFISPTNIVGTLVSAENLSCNHKF